ncbi:MAG TPA: hypothetical protein VMW47_01085 [Verrucomicrobiae bacterium]|nr:hypothetical protein [Verrucomicrobiae bacterium]
MAGGAILTCGLLAACGPRSVPLPTVRTHPAQLVLTLAELPYPGFQAEPATPGAGPRSNRTVAGGSREQLATLRRQGRVTGFVADFSRPVSVAQAVGPVVIQSGATVYRTGADARAALDRAAAALTAVGDTQVSTGRLGQAAVAFSSQRTAVQVTYEQYAVEWRQANVLNSVVVEGNAQTLDLGYALSLARLQQRQQRP